MNPKFCGSDSSKCPKKDVNSGSVNGKKRKYPSTCPVQGCPTPTARKGFYYIPENPVMRQAWLDACKLPQSTARTAKICYRHFLISDFRNEQTEESISQFQFGRLKENVVPSQNLPKFAFSNAY